MQNMKPSECTPDSNEFLRFHRLLTAKTDNYDPWYFALEKKNKDPVKSKRGWKHPSSKLTAGQAARWMDHGYNIGIAGTPKDKLVIVDVDSEHSVPIDQIKPTLSVRSRSREGRHHFYFTDDEPVKRDYTGVPIRTAKMNLPCDTAGEIRSYWQYVVAPGSFVPCSQEAIDRMPPEQQQFAGYYTIEDPRMPAQITYDELPQAYKDQLEANIKRFEETPSQPREEYDNPTKSGIFELTIADILGVLPTDRRFPCPFHGSETGSNASFDGNLLHCWRHDVSHNALTTLAVVSGTETCVDAGKGHRNSSVGPSVVSDRNGKQMFALWKYAKENRLIEEDSQMPASALAWFAQTCGICSENDLNNGLLKVEHYKAAKDLARAAGILT